MLINYEINHVSLRFEYLTNGQLDCLSKKHVINSDELDFLQEKKAKS